ncbi:MAG: DUF4402 domain-containing protein [Novosphingobium sp.]
MFRWAVPCILAAALPASAAEPERPLTIEITSGLEFSRLAMTGQDDGQAQIDARTGSRRVAGGLVGLGGMTVQGRGRITGTPLRSVRIDLPAQVGMTTPGGGRAELSGLATDLPDFPMLDASGVLEFSFGGKLRVQAGAGGTFRARIPISVDYN